MQKSQKLSKTRIKYDMLGFKGLIRINLELKMRVCTFIKSLFFDNKIETYDFKLKLHKD